MRTLLIIALVFVSKLCILQSYDIEMGSLEKKKLELLDELEELDKQLLELNHLRIISSLKKVGLPSNNYIEHSAMILEYSEEHEQAKWVSHVIIPEIKFGNVSRSNDFRVDPKITTGTAVQADYFLTDTLADGTVNYDGFGYDRGHLAPSADFRWSQKALSESYYYSNMSPQSPDFNREKWAELEAVIRRYVVDKQTPLFVVTLPLLHSSLDKVERSINKVSIPEKYGKVIYDPTNKRGIGFIMENKALDYPLEKYAMSIDDVEEVVGLNFFQNIDESIESKLNKKDWFTHLENGDVEPLDVSVLPKGCFNSIQAKNKIGKKVSICGRVVSARFSKKGHLWLNLDKHFPNQVFSIFVRKENLVNFDYNLKEKYINADVCVSGKVEKFSDSPSISLSQQNNIATYNK